MKTYSVYIDPDPSTLGPDATPHEVDRYRRQLCAELGKRTGCALVPCDDAGAEDAPLEVVRARRDIEEGCEWIDVLERALA